jgi:hypothetical protein
MKKMTAELTRLFAYIVNINGSVLITGFVPDYNMFHMPTLIFS